MVGIRLAVPLATRRDMRPAPVRVRLPDYYDWRKWTQVLKDRNEIRTDVAIPLETGRDLVSWLRGRDRINELWLRSQVERLAQSAAGIGRP
jgi:hypothetical protein